MISFSRLEAEQKGTSFLEVDQTAHFSYELMVTFIAKDGKWIGVVLIAVEDFEMFFAPYLVDSVLQFF